MNELFENTKPEEWISVLPTYQKNTIQEILSNGGSYEDAAEIWLDQNGPENTYPFGAENRTQNMYKPVYDEVIKVFCDENAYKDLKKQAKDLWNTNKIVVIASIAGTVGSTLGIAAAAITPVIALILAFITQVGLNSWCNSCMNK